MIYIDYNKETNEVVFLIKRTENFNKIISFLKKVKATYSIEHKVWLCSPNSFIEKEMLRGLSLIDKIDMQGETLDAIDAGRIDEKELVLKRNRFDNISTGIVLYPFQEEDVKKCLTQNAVLNANECGLGKTIETIATFTSLYHNKTIGKILILCVPEVLYNWKLEILDNYDIFSEEDILICSKDLRNPFDEEYKDKKIIIASYNTWLLITRYYGVKEKKTKDIRKNILPMETWLQGNKAVLVLDEAHKIKNRTTYTFRYIKLIKEFFQYRYLLTATPWPNNIAEVWSLMYMLDKGVLGSVYNDFVDKIAIVGTYRSKWEIKEFIPEKVMEVRDKLLPYIIQRKKREELPDLPNLDIQKVYVPISKLQREIYQKVVMDELTGIKERNDSELKSLRVSDSFPYLVLACSDVSILKTKIKEKTSKDLEKLIGKWDFKQNSKLPICSDILKERIGEENKKVILWSNHPVTCDLLGEYYQEYNPIVLHGENKLPNGVDKDRFRAEQLMDFRKNPDRKLLVMSPLVGGTGTNIPEAPIAIFWDRDFSSKNYLQALGRNDRATSKEDIFVYLLILTETLEIVQDKILDRKVKLNEFFIQHEYLTQEEWADIFTGKFKNK